MLLFFSDKTSFIMVAEPIIQLSVHVHDLLLVFVTGRGKGPGCADGSVQNYSGKIKMTRTLQPKTQY